MSHKTAMSVLKTTMSLKTTMFVQNCRCWRPAASHPKRRRDAVAPCPFDKSSRYQRLFSCFLTLCMHPIAIATVSVCIALLCLSQSESLSLTAQLANPNLPDPAMSNSAVTFHNFVCRGCYERGPGSRSSSFFCSYKAVTTHIGRSSVCQSEGKGMYTVPVQYRPSGRAEDQEAGPVGAGGAWPVRPAAPAAAPGKHIVCYEWHIVCYDMAYDVAALYRMFLSM